MLTRLSIRDIVLIERLDLDFADGLSAMTGETGAGKSILLDSLSLALGARGDGGLVRAGQDKGQVTAVFEPGSSHPVHALLRENGMDDEGAVILKRVQSADGRTRAFINDQPVSASLLRQIGRGLVEVHGQHDDRALVDTASHRDLLDEHGELSALRQSVRAAWDAWRATLRERDVLSAKVAAGERESEWLRAAVEELQALAPMPGEETELADQRARMQQVERVASELDEANEALAGNASPLPALSSLSRRLERKVPEAPGLLTEAAELLGQAIDLLHQAQQSLERALRESEFDPALLERTEERLFALRAAARKHTVAVENLPDLAERLAGDLDAIDAGSERLVELDRKVGELEARYRSLAAELTDARRASAAALTQAVEAELPSLKLDQSRFMVQIDTASEAAGPEGCDTVEFWVRTNPGSRPGPMMKVASGGELSRFLLALKVSLADRGSAPTLVFDEIDSGAGGAVADAIGRRLARLATRVQVITVTHAPQIAARAERHFLITKAAAGEEDRVSTAVAPLAGRQRREEIARMLSGASVTDEARKAAERLIEAR